MRYLAVSALSHDGLVRGHNEDSLVVGPWTLCASTTLTPQTLYLPLRNPVVVAVADGLGGHPGGEEASSLAVTHLARIGPELTDEQALREGVLACNDIVNAEAARHLDRVAMGSTLAGIVIIAEGALVFNVGDSRVYTVDEGRLLRLTTDDNEAPGPGQVRSSVLTQAIGGTLGTEPIEPHVTQRPLGDADRFLLCTDGLTDAVEEDEIAEVLAGHDGGRAVFELWRKTIEAGAPDNVTVALAELNADPDVR